MNKLIEERFINRFLLQYNFMGNSQLNEVFSISFTKNWIKLPNSRLYRNMLTGQCIQEQVIEIQSKYQYEQLKKRIRQTNPYICQVLSITPLHQNKFLVYLEHFSEQINLNDFSQWKQQKRPIVEAFITLSKQYGNTRVCPQMIGWNSFGQIKVWINPDPIRCKPWKPCSSESLMLFDILAILRQIQDYSLSFVNKKPQKHKIQRSTDNIKQAQSLHDSGKNSIKQFSERISLQNSIQLRKNPIQSQKICNNETSNKSSESKKRYNSPVKSGELQKTASSLKKKTHKSTNKILSSKILDSSFQTSKTLKVPVKKIEEIKLRNVHKSGLSNLPKFMKQPKRASGSTTPSKTSSLSKKTNSILSLTQTDINRNLFPVVRNFLPLGTQQSCRILRLQVVHERESQFTSLRSTIRPISPRPVVPVGSKKYSFEKKKTQFNSRNTSFV